MEFLAMSAEKHAKGKQLQNKDELSRRKFYCPYCGIVLDDQGCCKFCKVEERPYDPEKPVYHCNS
jgi:hypothetical protein